MGEKNMKNYILLRDLPDAERGTRLIWDEGANAFYYEKTWWVSPYNRNYLTAGQVTQSPEWFCEENIQVEQKYTIEDMQYCFEQSRLTHPMVGFKYDSFLDFLTAESF